MANSYGSASSGNPFIVKARGFMYHRAEVKVGEQVYKAEFSSKGEVDDDFAKNPAMLAHVVANIRAAFKGTVPTEFARACILAGGPSGCPVFAKALHDALTAKSAESGKATK
jgi:hypothetical protein